jgi:hypothetical protein
MNFAEDLFHALWCIRKRRRAGALRPGPCAGLVQSYEDVHVNPVAVKEVKSSHQARKNLCHNLPSYA